MMILYIHRVVVVEENMSCVAPMDYYNLYRLHDEISRCGPVPVMV